MSLSLPRQPSSVTRARHVLATLLGLTDATAESRGHLAVLITEACANAVMHSDHGSEVDISILIDEGTCTVEVSNRGSEPDSSRLTTEPPDPLTLDGRGLPLIATLADSAQFIACPPGDGPAAHDQIPDLPQRPGPRSVAGHRRPRQATSSAPPPSIRGDRTANIGHGKPRRGP